MQLTEADRCRKDLEAFFLCSILVEKFFGEKRRGPPFSHRVGGPISTTLLRREGGSRLSAN